MTVGFLHGQSAYEPEPGDRLDYVERGLERFSRDRTTWGSAGICGAPCPISCPTALHHGSRGKIDIAKSSRYTYRRRTE